jgi:hypothetical protein
MWWTNTEVDRYGQDSRSQAWSRKYLRSRELGLAAKSIHDLSDRQLANGERLKVLCHLKVPLCISLWYSSSIHNLRLFPASITVAHEESPVP